MSRSSRSLYMLCRNVKRCALRARAGGRQGGAAWWGAGAVVADMAAAMAAGVAVMAAATAAVAALAASAPPQRQQRWKRLRRGQPHRQPSSSSKWRGPGRRGGAAHSVSASVPSPASPMNSWSWMR